MYSLQNDDKSKFRNGQPAGQLYSRISGNCREKESFKMIHSSHDWTAGSRFAHAQMDGR